MKKNKYSKAQRILAIIGIVLLVGLYVTALVSAFFKSAFAQGILCAALLCTVFVPVVIYLFQFFTKTRLSDRDQESDSSDN